MDLWKEFIIFAEGKGLLPTEALSRIATIRSYRIETLKPKGKKGKQTRSPYYLRFIERSPCIICGSKRGVLPVLFTLSGKMTANRASDYNALPICTKCSDSKEAVSTLQPYTQMLQLRFLQTYLQCVEGT